MNLKTQNLNFGDSSWNPRDVCMHSVLHLSEQRRWLQNALRCGGSACCKAVAGCVTSTPGINSMPQCMELCMERT